MENVCGIDVSGTYQFYRFLLPTFIHSGVIHLLFRFKYEGYAYRGKTKYSISAFLGSVPKLLVLEKRRDMALPGNAALKYVVLPRLKAYNNSGHLS